MTIIRISAAELFSKPHEFLPEEKAFLEGLTEEELEERARNDPDAQPSTPEMLRQGQENRRSRLRFDAFRDLDLGARLEKADSDLDLPTFELTDEHGNKLLIKAAACRRISPPDDIATRILKLEAVVAKSASRMDDAAAAPTRSPEKQTR